jgi:hypothetical protein
VLIIRNEQIRALEETARKSFEDRMVEYLSRQLPDVCGIMDETTVRESIQKGIEHAGRYGIRSEYDVARYIELRHRFSQDFETVFDAPWAKEILENPDMDSHPKMNELWERACQEMERLGLQSSERN